jgi:diguanylate cyclase (GGDEF)-like protein
MSSSVHARPGSFSVLARKGFHVHNEMMEKVKERLTALAVDDEPLNLKLLKSLLEPVDLELVTALDGFEAQKLMQQQTFDLLLFDIMMPEIDGLTLTRWARQDPLHKDVPILILTSMAGKDVLMEAFEAGAVDFLTKPFHGPELIYRVKAQLKLRTLQRRMETFANELNLQVLKAMQTEAELLQSQAALADANKTLSDWAHRDSLTGLWNRRKAWELMEYEAQRSLRKERTIGIAMLDLDKFKAINDQFGHDAGDRVLKQAAQALEQSLRKGDLLARWGGEEFLAVFPETNLKGTLIAAEKLRLAVQSAAWSLVDRSGMTVSIGIALKHPSVPWDPVLKEADAALYRAKENGRNRVAV